MLIDALSRLKKSLVINIYVDLLVWW